jgi:hypothetical protein
MSPLRSGPAPAGGPRRYVALAPFAALHPRETPFPRGVPRRGRPPLPRPPEPPQGRSPKRPPARPRTLLEWFVRIVIIRYTISTIYIYMYPDLHRRSSSEREEQRGAAAAGGVLRSGGQDAETERPGGAICMRPSVGDFRPFGRRRSPEPGAIREARDERKRSILGPLRGAWRRPPPRPHAGDEGPAPTSASAVFVQIDPRLEAAHENRDGQSAGADCGGAA